jgi:5'-3' exonuclease
MKIYLVDGTYELFRHFFAVPSAPRYPWPGSWCCPWCSQFCSVNDRRWYDHIGVATDHVVESFRNDLYPGYKTSEGVAPELLSQFPILEEALQAMGVLCGP